MRVRKGEGNKRKEEGRRGKEKRGKEREREGEGRGRQNRREVRESKIALPYSESSTNYPARKYVIFAFLFLFFFLGIHIIFWHFFRLSISFTCSLLFSVLFCFIFL